MKIKSQKWINSMKETITWKKDFFYILSYSRNKDE